MEPLIPIFLFLCIAAVLILRPVTKKLGLLLEAFARSKMAAPAEAGEVARLQAAGEQLSKRLDLVDERLDFTERLVSAAQRHGTAPRLDYNGPASPRLDTWTRERDAK